MSSPRDEAADESEESREDASSGGTSVEDKRTPEAKSKREYETDEKISSNKVAQLAKTGIDQQASPVRISESFIFFAIISFD